MTSPHRLRIADRKVVLPATPDEMKEWYSIILQDFDSLSSGAILHAFYGCFVPSLYRRPDS